MKNKLSTFGLLFFILLITVSSCKDDEPQFYSPKDEIKMFTDDEYATISQTLDLPNLSVSQFADYYSFKFPRHLGGKDVSVNAIETTLGRVLFYDKDLSIDRTISCASCHLQNKAFADDKAFSDGVNGQHTDRNSIAIGSFSSVAGEYGIATSSVPSKLFWDERADNFVQQMEQTFMNPKEMGMSMTELKARVNSKEYYKILGKKAYNVDILSIFTIKDALTEFMSSFHATQSPFDLALNQLSFGSDFSQEFTSFTERENIGKNIFEANCNSCHTLSTTFNNGFTIPFSTANNGLDMEYEDQGLGAFTGFSGNNGKFKIPALKNIEVSGPYMHDGRFETLEDVVDHYNDGIRAHPNLHAHLKEVSGKPKKLNLTENEKISLVDFLKTLTDDNLLTNPKYSDPFK